MEFFCTGGSSFEVKIEADSNDTSEYPPHWSVQYW